MVAPFDQFPGRILQLFDRRSAVIRIPPGQANQSAPKPGCAFTELALHPGAKSAFIDARGLLFGQFLEGRIDDGFHRPLAQNLGAKGMDCSDRGFFQMFERVLDVGAFGGSFGRDARAVELLAQPKLQFAGGFVGERNRNDMADGGEAAGQHGDNAGNQFGGFARAGGSFDEQAFGERSTDAISGGAVVELRLNCNAHCQ